MTSDTRGFDLRDDGKDVLMLSSISDHRSEKRWTWFFEIAFKEQQVMAQAY